VEQQNVNSGGIGFVGALTLLFIGLKLGNVIDWSWWWVLSPPLFILGIFIIILLGAFAGAIIVAGKR